jgi:hypothetical protein
VPINTIVAGSGTAAGAAGLMSNEMNLFGGASN